MNSLASQSSSHMAGDLCYAAAQTSALMVFAANRVFRVGVNEKQLKTLQGVMASIREELHDSEDDRRALSEQNCIVACVLASELARCQRQLAHSRVDRVVSRGGLQSMLEKGVVHVIKKVIESAELTSGIQGVREACKALGFEKGKQLSDYSTIAGEPEVPDHGCVVRRVEEVDDALSSLTEMDFVGLFRLGKLDCDGFR
ncbi:unnamed protein product [Lactuca saligna]|uniref:Uncharacterized protein n=1 Tax=Lactuca saligna TaxID=75948 RepID=A0AA35ZUL2_LACSI|nr:unnamed protein product [Lactuca saligna]